LKTDNLMNADGIRDGVLGAWIESGQLIGMINY
jgi:hypothetical protein